MPKSHIFIHTAVVHEHAKAERFTMSTRPRDVEPHFEDPVADQWERDTINILHAEREFEQLVRG